MKHLWGALPNKTNTVHNMLCYTFFIVYLLTNHVFHVRKNLLLFVCIDLRALAQYCSKLFSSWNNFKCSMSFSFSWTESKSNLTRLPRTALKFLFWSNLACDCSYLRGIAAMESIQRAWKIPVAIIFLLECP